MKNTFLVLLAASTIALGAICVVQWQKLAGQKTQIGALRSEMELKTREVADLQATHSLLETQRRELFTQVGALADKLQASQTAEAKGAGSTPGGDSAAAPDSKPNKEKGGFGSFLAKMMEDPETKKMIREQQRMMLDQLYNPLIKKLALTPEEAAQFKDLIADNMLKSTEKATSLLGGESATNRTAMIEKLGADQKDFEEQVRGFLGETRYAEYKDYQMTVGERTQLSQFQQQNAGGENALTDPQTEKLRAFMKEEKQAVAAATGQPSPGTAQDAANLQSMLSGEGVDKLLQTQETVNQRVYDRAKGTLSESQLQAFGKFQTNQLQMMRMGMNMARKFMTPEQTGSTPPAPSGP